MLCYSSTGILDGWHECRCSVIGTAGGESQHTAAAAGGQTRSGGRHRALKIGAWEAICRIKHLERGVRLFEGYWQQIKVTAASAQG